MKNLSKIFIFSLMCILGLTSCDWISKSNVLDTDKYLRNPKQAVIAMFTELPKLPKYERNKLEEVVKFKESDKFSDFQKNRFFEELKKKEIEVDVKKVKTLDDYTEVQCEITCNGKTEKHKLHLYKEDNIWKTEVGFKLLQFIISG
ncbi:MAG: hypothetical protein IK100_02265 [Muribaculaceae bacterium]|nr:hypothetical protein [Muribaculaceae bacterium]